jgi:hypothetical protein
MKKFEGIRFKDMSLKMEAYELTSLESILFWYVEMEPLFITPLGVFGLRM